MPADNILVLVIDGLRAGALGAYGNTTFPTPALDQFAAESFLLDSAFADSTDLPAIYRALWQSLHPLRPAAMSGSVPSLVQLLSTHGYHTTLITDDQEIGSYDAAAGFDECVQLDGEASARAVDISQTCLAQLLAAGCEAIRSSHEKSRLVWVHSRGMYGPWDAPLDLQESLLDREEGDPAPCESVDPPAVALAEMPDADAAYAISCAYAAQVMVLDDSIDMVRKCLLDRAPEERWLAAIVGGRGFSLGEHGHVGGDERQLLAEAVHVPMLWRFPDGMGALARSHRLVSHLDVLPTLIEWISDGSEGPASSWDGLSLLPLARGRGAAWRDELLASSRSGQLAIRTSEWCLQRKPIQSDDEEASFELFVRPDDQREVNDVASLCSEVVERLSKALDTASRRLINGEELLALGTLVSPSHRDIPL